MTTGSLCAGCGAGLLIGVKVCPICGHSTIGAVVARPAVSLRPLQSGDLDDLYRWSQDRDLNAFTGAWPTPPSRDELAALLAGWLVDPTFRAFMIRYSDRSIGNCWLGHIADGSATLGILIAEPAYRDKGLGTETMRLLLAQTTGLEKVTLWVYADNPRATAVYRKVGFVKTGRSQNAGRAAITMERPIR